MRKLAFLISGLALIGACNQQPEGLEAKKEKLSEKENELSELEAEIRSLRQEISAQDTTQTEKKLTPVQVKQVQTQHFNHFISVTGTVTSNENVMLSAETNGRVVAIPAKEGQQVRKGEVLVRLDNEALQNQLDEAQANFELAQTTFERRQRLWEDSIGSEIEYLNAKTNFQSAKNRLGQIQATYDNSFIKSPVNGKVDEIAVNTGEFVGAGTPIVRVVDMNNLEVEAELSEQYLDDIGVGDSVIVEIPTLDIRQSQPVIFAGQYINPNNRSFKIKVSIDNDSQLLKPNLLADLKINDYQNQNALVVPSITVNQDLKGEYVYVLENGERPTVHRRYVEKGRSFSDQTEIKSGLEPGDQVVVAGFNEVSDGEPVRVK